MFWLICAALAAIVALAILAPFRRGARDGAPAGPAAYDLGVYRDQLREVDRDLARGVIGAEDAERLRTEIGRKVLDADRRLTAEGAGSGVRRGGAIGAGVAMAATLAFAAAVYWREGTPLADLPLSARVAAAQAAYDARPGQAEAEARAVLPAPPVPDPAFAELVGRLRDTVARRPDDPQGLALLAQNEARLGNVAAALDAQRRLVAVRGAQASAQDHAELAALMVQAAGGIITAEAEAEIARALARDPRQPQARYMTGLLQAQNGRPDRTFPIWAGLLAEGPEDAPWIAPIRATIRDLAWLAGQPDYVPPEPAMPALPPDDLPGPDAGAMAAAADMTPEERQAMIADMVGRLESRLATEGGTPEEWARLISSLVVIGQKDHAAAIWAEARTRFGDRPEALAPIAEAARASGLAE